MAYIGRGLDKISNIEKLDVITFDGSQSYTLQKNSTNYSAVSSNNLLISIDGVVQSGNFTVSGSTIDFGVAVASTSVCDFIMHFGTGVTTQPSDGSVTDAKLAASAINSQTAETSPALNDEVLIYDTSATALRKMTREKLVGCSVLQDQVTATSVSSVEMDLPTDYNWFKLVIHMAHPVTDGQDLEARASVDGGATYIDSSNTYSKGVLPLSTSGNAPVVIGSKNQNKIAFSAGVGNATEEQVGGSLEIFPKKDTDANRGGNYVKTFAVNYNANGDYRYYEGGFHVWGSPNKTINSFKLFFTSGNIDKIIYSLYGFHS